MSGISPCCKKPHNLKMSWKTWLLWRVQKLFNKPIHRTYTCKICYRTHRRITLNPLVIQGTLAHNHK